MEVGATPTPTAVSSSGGAQQQPPPGPPAKKKRALPGMPDPDAEVIALSPKTLLATNRFVCEICNKGFQRDQNLQLHRRGHNLPWKLRQRSGNGKDVVARKRVYVCPEPSCVHHDPARALGDLTGIKKHFCRKHGEKKWRCDKCSKKYAVQSDWKAHTKTCGSREYRCDCGTLFSRRDSFITHRAFCDALAEESAKARVGGPAEEDGSSAAVGPPPPPPPSGAPALAAPPPLRQQTPPPLPAAAPVPPHHAEQRNERETNVPEPVQFTPAPTQVSTAMAVATQAPVTAAKGNASSSVVASPQNPLSGMFAPSSMTPAPQFGNLSGGVGGSDRALPTKPPPLCLATDASSSIFSAAVVATDRQQFAPPLPPPSPSPHMSATALLQKAAQMGATSSSSSFLRGLGLDVVATSSPGASSSGQQHNPETSLQQWPPRLDNEPPPMLSAGLDLGLPYDPSGASVSLPELIMGHQSSLFSAKPATLDFLGLGMSPTGASASRGLSAFIPPIGGAVGIGGSSAGGAAETFVASHGAQGKPWERNPSSSPIL